MAALEQECLRRASGIVADSASILAEVKRRYDFAAGGGPCRVVWLGLSPGRNPAPARPVRDFVEALVVGRLEARKGTAVLFEELPGLLRGEPRLRVRFVGSDNSVSDGFHARTGHTYPDFFRREHPDLLDRVRFEGYVSDARLESLYRDADILLAPSLYESFGLVFLEAMRSALPIVGFDCGGAAEVFAGGERDGALLVAPDDRAALRKAIGRLVGNPAQRSELGRRARERFDDRFRAGRMADDTARFYADLRGKRGARTRPRARRVLQVMEALDYGDGVSGICRQNARLLREVGGDGDILALQADRHVAAETRPLHTVDPHDALIVHYWNWSRLELFLRTFPGPKAIHFHNITPPRYFAPGTAGFEATRRGYRQLHGLADVFDLILGDSEYDLEAYRTWLSNPRPTLCLYPVVEPKALAEAPFDEALLERLRGMGEVLFLFVGRVARSKRQDRVMEVFDRYWCDIERRSRLLLVGDTEASPDYHRELMAFRERLPSGEHIDFVGKVSDEAVGAYYRAARFFLCASEHEGVGIPLLEAMTFGVPVVALAKAAVPETLGSGGILVRSWDTPRLAELADLLERDQLLRERILEGQRLNLDRFSAAEARRRLGAAVGFLREGRSSPLFVTRGPSENRGTPRALA